MKKKLYPLLGSQPLKDVAVVILNTGMRPDEVFHVRGEEMNLEQKYISFPNGKTKVAQGTVPCLKRL